MKRPQRIPASQREWDLAEQHHKLMREKDHDGSRHCQCAIAKELTALQELRDSQYYSAYEQYRKWRELEKASELRGLGC